MRAVQFNGKLDETGVPLYHALQRVFLGEILGVILELQNDLRAAGQIGGGFNLIAAGVFAGPAPTLFLGSVGTAEHGDLGSHHEGGIKADAELADEAGVGLLILRELF